MRSIRSNYIGNQGNTNGGAVYVTTNSQLEMENVTFKGNYVTYGNGGALMATGQSAVNLENVSFVSNSAIYGGGALYTYASEDKLVENRLDNVHFENNHVHFLGAAIYVGPWVRMTALQCHFIKNNADFAGGAVKVDESTESCFEQCTFVNNTAKLKAGALYVKQQESSEEPTTKVKLANCLFRDNEAKKAAAIFAEADMKIPSPALETLNTVLSVSGAYNLNTNEANFSEMASELNVIIYQPNPQLNVEETPFASGNILFVIKFVRGKISRN